MEDNLSSLYVVHINETMAYTEDFLIYDKGICHRCKPHFL